MQLVTGGQAGRFTASPCPLFFVRFDERSHDRFDLKRAWRNAHRFSSRRSPGWHDHRSGRNLSEPVVDPSGEQAAPTVAWLADYVYGTISTLIAVAGLTFETHPEALTTTGVIVVSTVAIWFAHTLSRLVSKSAGRHLELTRSDIGAELRGSWSIVTAAVPAIIIFFLAGLHVWSVHVAFVLTDVVGVAALAVVGIGTAGGRERPLGRRIAWVVGLLAVGATIVVLESLVHLL